MTHAADVEAYAAYLNSAARAREHYGHEELEIFEQDVAKAEAAMERSWLESLMNK